MHANTYTEELAKIGHLRRILNMQRPRGFLKPGN